MFDFNGNNVSEVNENTESVIETKTTNILDQTLPHHSRSEKYLVIPTREVLDVFQELGFTYSEESLWATKSRKNSRKGKGKHMITLRHPDLQLDPVLRNELIPQMYLWNSYDGSLRLKLAIGLFRGACLNTMVFGSQIVEPILFKHIAGMNNKEFRKKQLMDQIKTVADKFKEASSYVLNLKNVVLTHDQKLAFARRMVEIRLLGTTNPEVTLESKGIEITDAMLEESILNPHRDEDVGDSAWLVANVVQENLLSHINHSAFTYTKTTVNKENETVRKERKARLLKNKVRMDEINVALFQVMNEVIDEAQVKMAA